MIQRSLRQFVLAVLALALLGGYAFTRGVGSAQSRQAPQRTAQQPNAPSPSAAVTIRWFMRWDAARVATVAEPLIAAFEAAHPEIQVKLETVAEGSAYYRALALQLDQGDPPDLFYPATHVAYALDLRQQLLPVDTTALDLTVYDPAVLELYRNAAGELICLPADLATLAVAYNKTLFDQAAVPYPDDKWSWAEFRATAQALTKANATSYGVDRFYRYWPLLVWSWSGHNQFDDPHFPTQFLLNDEAAIDALQWLADLGKSGLMPPREESDADAGDLFLQGRAAMQIAGHWQVPAYLAAGLDVDFAPLPHGKYTVNRGDGSCFAIPRTTPHAAAARTFVDWLAGPTGAGARLLTELQAVTPARRDLQQSAAFLNPPVLPDHNLAAFLATDAQRFGLYDPLHPIQTRWQAAADEILEELWQGERNAAATVEQLTEEAAEILANLAPPPAALTTTVAPTAPFSAGSTLNLTLPLTLPLSLSQPITALISPLLLPRHYYVSPQARAGQSGLSAATPLATLQQALTLAAPGDTIHLAPGDYRENVLSVNAGRADAPITIMGPPTAVLRGNGEASAAFYLTHSYYTLVGFTIDGLFGDPQDPKGYTEKLLYVQGKGEGTGVTGLRVLQMNFQHAGGECLRLRYFAQRNEIAYSIFHTCGLLDFEFHDGGKNGEAIYIGTAADQWADGKNPTAVPDESSYNWIHHNVMNTQGNECVEIKEGGYANLIEYNRCTGQLDPESAGIGARGSGNMIRYNVIYGNLGAGIRLGGHEAAGVIYGTRNAVYGNDLFENVAGGIQIMVEPQAQICGNQVERNLGKSVFGDGSDTYRPTFPCS